ncbi:CpaD family pilus assembly protein [Magnetospirillum moscoviense]|nr:CpaD family pilus assembly lipoprotein [Magnetospirillum moscoviense]
MKRFLVPLAALTLAACAQPVDLADFDTRLAHPVSVHRTEARLVVQTPLPVDDARRLSAFAADYLRRGAGPLELAVVAAGEDDPQARDSAEKLAQELMARGVRAAEIKARLVWDSKPGDTGMAVLSYPHHVAKAPECGSWTNPLNWNNGNRNTDNFGCAVQRNIALMAADPRDLESARPVSGRDGERAADILGKYQKGQTIAAPKEVGSYTTTTTQTGNTTSGK